MRTGLTASFLFTARFLIFSSPHVFFTSHRLCVSVYTFVLVSATFASVAVPCFSAYIHTSIRRRVRGAQLMTCFRIALTMETCSLLLCLQRSR